jgi:hypothetical protein
MREKAPTKSELHEMLAEALRNRASPPSSPSYQRLQPQTVKERLPSELPSKRATRERE